MCLYIEPGIIFCMKSGCRINGSGDKTTGMILDSFTGNCNLFLFFKWLLYQQSPLRIFSVATQALKTERFGSTGVNLCLPPFSAWRSAFATVASAGRRSCRSAASANLLTTATERASAPAGPSTSWSAEPSKLLEKPPMRTSGE